MIDEFGVFFRLAFVIIVILVMVTLVVRYALKQTRELLNFYFRKETHLLLPGSFSDRGTKSARSWINDFDIWLSESQFQDNKTKHAALLYRLDDNIRKRCYEININAKTDYGILKSILLDLFGTKAKTQSEYHQYWK